MKCCVKHGIYLPHLPQRDALDCPDCVAEGRIQAENADLRTALKMAQEFGDGMIERDAHLHGYISEVVTERDALERRLNKVREALAKCTCMCKWVAEARAACDAG